VRASPIIVAMLAAIHALQGQKVDVLTTSEELSIPEVKKQMPFFEMLGLTIGENSKKNATDDEARHAIDQKDIVYGTAEDFQADIISTEFFRRNIRGDRGFGVVLVDEVDSMLFDDRNYSTQLSSLTPAMNHLEHVLGRVWNQIAIVASCLRTIDGQHYYMHPKKVEQDTAEDETKTEQSSQNETGVAPNEEEVEAVSISDPRVFLRNATCDYLSAHLRELNSEEREQLAAYKASERHIEQLRDKASKNEEEHKPALDAAIAAHKEPAWSKVTEKKPYLEIPVHLQDFARKQMPKWIENAIDALLCYQKDKHYHVKGGKVVPIDYSNTGVLQHNTVWDDGLAPFLQIKEGLKVTPEGIATNFISKPGYFKRYTGRLYGLTGTLGNTTTRNFLQEMYGVDMVTIPPYKCREILNNDASRYLCKELLPRLVPTSTAWYDAIVENTLRAARNGQAVLVICNYMSQVHRLRERLVGKYDASKLFTYTGEQDFKQHWVDTGEIILAPTIAERGTDLTTSAAVEERGGLHVCITFLPESYRVELQNAGRTARQGKKGSAQLILCTSSEETLQDLRAQRDQQEAKAIEQAKQDVDQMLSSDRLFVRYCGVEASFFPTMEAVAKMELSQRLLAACQAHMEVALSSDAVQELYEERVQKLLDTELIKLAHVLLQKETAMIQEMVAAGSYTKEARRIARDALVQEARAGIVQKLPLAEFRKQHETKEREAFLLQQKMQEDIPADVLIAILNNQVYVPPGADLAQQYDWSEADRHGSQERWGIWLKKDGAESDMNGAARHRRFDGLEKELQSDAQRDKLIQNPYYYVEKGNELLQRSFSGSAVHAYNKAIALDPLYSVNARFNKARALLISKKNKDDHSEAKQELEEAQYLIRKQKNELLTFDSLVGQTGKKLLTSEHVQHQLDILSQQENYIQSAIGVIEGAQDKDWDVEITEIKSLQELFQEAPGERKQAIEEAQCNGFTCVFTIKENNPKGGGVSSLWR